MPYVYEREAVDCPVPQDCPDDLSLYADPPLPDTYDAVAQGAAAAQSLRDKINRNAARAELTARFGGGFVGILAGLDLSASGLTGTVAAGKANVSGPVENADNFNFSLTNNADNFVWISKNGSVNKRTSSDGSPLEPPDDLSTWCYLGMIPVTSGTPGDIDLSGVIYLRGMPYRRTADATTPADTPPADARFLTRGASSWWLWDGEEYVSPLDPDHTVIAEGGDPSPGALDAKIKAGAGITLAVVTDTGVRKVQISADSGALDWKQSVRAASTGNLTLSGAQTIDGVACIAGDRVLAKDQTTGSQNGIYVVAAGAWSRATDADASADVTAGMLVTVTEGDTQRDTVWALTTNDAITLGTTSLAFGQVAAVRHVETFTTQFSPGLGSSLWRCDFSARGQFLTDYFARCTTDGDGVQVEVLDGSRTGTAFNFQILVSGTATYGTYGGREDVELVWRLEGWQWVAGSGPTDTPTLTEDTHDYSGGGETGGIEVQNDSISVAAHAIALSFRGAQITDLGGGTALIDVRQIIERVDSTPNPVTLSDGPYVIHEINENGALAGLTVLMPAAPDDGDIHVLKRIGNTSPDGLTISANTGQTLENSSGLVGTSWELEDGPPARACIITHWSETLSAWLVDSYTDAGMWPF